MIVTFFVGLSVESSRVGRFALQASTNTSTCYFALISKDANCVLNKVTPCQPRFETNLTLVGYLLSL